MRNLRSSNIEMARATQQLHVANSPDRYEAGSLYRHEAESCFGRRWRPLLLPFVAFSLILLFAQQALSVAAYPAAPQADLPDAGFVADGAAVRDTTNDTVSPALALPMDSDEPWVALVDNDRVYVSKFVAATTSWEQQGGVLNRSSANAASHPGLAFAGSAGDVPWVVWREEVDGTGLINASIYNGTAWNPTAIVNRNPARDGAASVIAVAPTPGGTTPLPWLAWTEASADGVPQVVVSHAVADERAPSGFDWQAVDTTLNLDSARVGNAPDIAFAGVDGDLPWVVWSESGGDRASRVFAKQWLDDSWVTVGRQEGCGNEVACALNRNANQNASNAQIATGMLPGESVPTPWVVFSETDGSGTSAIYVMRMDIGDAGTPDDDRFVAVGGAINAQCLGNANAASNAANNVDVQSAGLRSADDAEDATALSGGSAITPDITFVGNVPHVSWVENVGMRAVLHVCHLADARAGLERWDLDSFDGVNRSSAPAVAPILADNEIAPYVAWQETISTTAEIFVAHREPLSAAWAINFPATLNNVSGAPVSEEEAQALLTAWGRTTAADLNAPLLRSAGVPLMTAAYHVNGAAKLEEIHFQLTSSDAPTGTPAFLGRYVISDNLVYVQDPENPGSFFPPVEPGSTTNVNTPVVTLDTSEVRVETHGSASAALDLWWSLIFEDATFFNTYVQSVNVVFDGGQETGFHQVGTVYVGNQIYLPAISNGE